MREIDPSIFTDDNKHHERKYSVREEILSIVLKSMEDMNRQLDPAKRLEIRSDASIDIRAGKLDSLDFVNLMVTIEDHVFQHFNKAITIVSERAFSKKDNPFADVTKLTDFILEILESQAS
jgi:acyl carrier protein